MLISYSDFVLSLTFKSSNFVAVKKIVRHIEYLLTAHDCVILPGLGAILAHQEPACYDQTLGVWTAPSRAFSFNPDLQRTDGLLAASIAHRDGISMAAAANIVTEKISQMAQALHSHGCVNLGLVGALNLDNEGRLSFLPSPSKALSPNNIWLPENIKTPMVVSQSQTTVSNGAPIKRSALHNIIRHTASAAACIVVVLALAWIIAQNFTDLSTQQTAAIAPEAKRQAVEMEFVENTQLPKVILTSAPEYEIIENDAPVLAETPAESYYMIVGSFATEAEAKKYISSNSGLNLGVLNKDGRWRIYGAKASSADKVMDLAKQEPLASRFNSWWICKN